MTKAVWKFALSTPGSSMTHTIPKGAVFAHVDWQEYTSYDTWQAWFVVDVDAQEYETRSLKLVATGQGFTGKYLGTFLHRPSDTVWHLIEVTDA
jgi:hypothetical protein